MTISRHDITHHVCVCLGHEGMVTWCLSVSWSMTHPLILLITGLMALLTSCWTYFRFHFHMLCCKRVLHSVVQWWGALPFRGFIRPTDRFSTARHAIASVRPSVRLSVRFHSNFSPLTLTVWRCTGYDHGSHGIEGQGQISRWGLWLGSQFETRSVGRRSTIEESLSFLAIVGPYTSVVDDGDWSATTVIGGWRSTLGPICRATFRATTSLPTTTGQKHKS